MQRLVLVAGVLLVATLAAAVRGASFDELKRPQVLTFASFDEAVMGSKMPQLIVFSADTTSAQADELAEEIEALGRVSIVSREETALLKAMDLTAESAPAFRVYPYGEDKSAPQDFDDANAAKEALLGSLPDSLVTVVRGQPEMQQFLVEALREQKVPCIMFSAKDEAPQLMVKIALWFEADFKIGFFANPPPDVIKSLQIDKLPALQLLIPQPGANDQVGFGNAPYDRKKFGGLKFTSIMRFLAIGRMELEKQGFFKDRDAAAKAAQADMPPTGGSAQPPPPIFEVTPETADGACEGKLGLCIVALLDGSPHAAEQRAETLAMLEKVQYSTGLKGRPLHFMWVDVVCHPSYAQAFDIDPATAPTLVAISPKKKRFANMLAAMEEKKVKEFVHAVLSGKQRIAPYLAGMEAVPGVSADDDCAAAHALMAPVEEEFDLSDIMGDDFGTPEKASAGEDEDDEDDEPAAVEASAQKSPEQLAAEEAEMEEKRRKAMEEVERLNKMSKKKRKKGKKGKKKKTKAKKDEL